MKRILLGLALLLGFQTLAVAQGIGPTTWTSQSGSVLKVTTLAGTTFRGVFVNLILEDHGAAEGERRREVEQSRISLID